MEIYGLSGKKFQRQYKKKISGFLRAEKIKHHADIFQNIPERRLTVYRRGSLIRMRTLYGGHIPKS
jgi:hypothetical protein